MAKPEATGFSREELLEFYRQLKTIREFEERINNEVNQGRLAGFFHLSSGAEADAVGVCAHLTNPADTLITHHRGHGHCIAAGTDVVAMFKEIFVSDEGVCRGRGGTFHIADFDSGVLGANGIVGGGGPIGVGAALANRLRGDGGVNVAYLGDGAMNTGGVLEALNLSVVLETPVVFFIEDNGYMEFTGGDFQFGCDSLAERTAAFGMPCVEVEGSDFFAVHKVAGEAIAHARSGKGPYAVVSHVPRFHAHYTGDPEDYRPEGEAADQRANRDVIKNFVARVLAAGELNQEELDQVDADVAEVIDNAVALAAAAPRPNPADVEQDVYVSY